MGRDTQPIEIQRNLALQLAGGARTQAMPIRPRQPFYACAGILLLLFGCDDGVVTIKPLPAASRGQAGTLAGAAGSAGASGGSGADTGRAGGGSHAGGRTGSGEPSWTPPPNPCDEGTEPEQAGERELRAAFLESFNSGDYCPDLPNIHRRQLTLDRELETVARGSICLAFTSAEWFFVRRTSTMGWVLLDTPNLEDAKNALLGGDHTQLCEEARRTPFRFVGVGHLFDAWTVFVSPGDPDEMQKP